MIYRIFAEKKPGFDVEGKKLFGELTAQLGLKGLESVRIINRYDVKTNDGCDINKFIYGIFAEINQDDVYYTLGELKSDESVFAVSYQPGQYDLRCDSAEQCMKLVDPEIDVKIRHAKIYILKGEVTESEINKVTDYIVNPVDSRLVDVYEMMNFDEESLSTERRVEIEGFREISGDGVKEFINKYSLAMDENDLMLVIGYFRDEEKRDPTLTEIKVLDTYWSDHCRHTTFSTIIEEVDFADGMINERIKREYEEYLKDKETIGRSDRPLTLMDLATIGAKINKYKHLLDDVEESEEVNACSYNIDVDVDGDIIPYLLMFKNETHNHPTEIEPFGGAATCLGGAIRDPLSGRSYVYQSMRVTGSADPTVPISETIPGKLPQRKITTTAASGFASYGNQIGLCTGQVKEYYHPDFAAKRMEVGAVIAAAPKENVRRESPAPGDIIYVIGGRTGRDGIGGASGSSKAHNRMSVETSGSEVQKGNAPEERKLQRLFRNAEFARLIKKCNDFGAGGVSVAIGELADSLDIDLDTVLLKYEGLTSTELAISESQERMAVVIEAKDEEKFLGLVRSENLEYSKTAVVTDSGRLIMRHDGQEVLNLSRRFIDTNGASKYSKVKVDMKDDVEVINIKGTDFTERMEDIALNLNTTSQKGLVEIFDNTIGAGTVLMPFGGKKELTPSDVMAAKIPVLSGNTSTVSVMAHGYDPYLAKENPYLGGLYSVISCVNKMVLAGIEYKDIKLSAQEYFGKLLDKPENWGNVFSALMGALTAQRVLGISAIGGKDSMSGTYEDINVPPTLITFGVGVTDQKNILTNVAQKAGSTMVLAVPEKDEDGVINVESYKALAETITSLIRSGDILSAGSVLYGGAMETVTKMCLGNGLGFEYVDGIELDKLNEVYYGSGVLELRDISVIEKLGEYAVILGVTTDDGVFRFGNEEVCSCKFVKQWETTLGDVFPIRKEEENKAEAISDLSSVTLINKGEKFANPRVFIPVFPGTNCEVDTLRAFEKAGAVGTSFVFRNKHENDINYSAEEMAKMINNAQIFALAGGFSAGDEPDGSGKFIVSVLNNPVIKDAVHGLLDRGGLILGICNGFQALIKTGLVPYGQIVDLKENSPTLTYNSIGRHVAKVVKTRIASVRSPWLAGVNVGDVHSVAISHGEGRFVADDETLAALIANGQVAAQYCDDEGNVIGNGVVNPNYSTYNIEAITSPDGRVLGKMGHSERIDSYLYKNLPSTFNETIFTSGVNYFK